MQCRLARPHSRFSARDRSGRCARFSACLQGRDLWPEELSIPAALHVVGPEGFRKDKTMARGVYITTVTHKHGRKLRMFEVSARRNGAGARWRRQLRRLRALKAAGDRSRTTVPLAAIRNVPGVCAGRGREGQVPRARAGDDAPRDARHAAALRQHGQLLLPRRCVGNPRPDRPTACPVARRVSDGSLLLAAIPIRAPRSPADPTSVDSLAVEYYRALCGGLPSEVLQTAAFQV